MSDAADETLLWTGPRGIPAIIKAETPARQTRRPIDPGRRPHDRIAGIDNTLELRVFPVCFAIAMLKSIPHPGLAILAFGLLG
jgi:hypothetical protein